MREERREGGEIVVYSRIRISAETAGVQRNRETKQMFVQGTGEVGIPRLITDIAPLVW